MTAPVTEHLTSDGQTDNADGFARLFATPVAKDNITGRACRPVSME